MRKFYILIFFIIINIQFLNAQIKDIGIIPFIKNYTASNYNAAEQNWAAIQDQRGIMYFANTDKSILEFDGKTWNKIKVPTPVFSFEIDKNGVIYVGGKGELGYLKADEVGVLNFISLKDKLPHDYTEFDKIWDIFITKDSSVCFQTFDEIFIYKQGNVEVIPVEMVHEKGLFIRAFQIYEEYYVHTKKKGLYILENGVLNFVENSEVFANDMVKGMLPYKDNKILIVTWSQGMFVYDGKSFTPLETSIDEVITNNIYRTTDINGEYFVFSLYNGGLLVTDTELDVVQLITSENGLQNDQVNNFFLDNQNNLWLCLANGIASINLFTPFTKFDTNYGFENESKTLTSKLFNNTLYIGTATGVYYKDWKKENKLSENEKFTNLENEKGNVKAYYLEQVEEKLICAGALGTFEIINNTANYIVKDRRLRTFKHLDKNSNILIGGATGLFLFEKEKTNWNFIDNIKNFDKYSRYIEEDEDGFIWMSDASKGISKIYLSPDYRISEKTILYNTENGLHGLPQETDNYVFKIKDEIVFGTNKGIYRYDKETDQFVAYEKLNSLIGENEPIVMIKEDSEGNIWFKQRRLITENEDSWELGVLLNKGDSMMSLLKKPFLRYKNKIFSFSQIDKNTYIIGAEDGFVHYDSRIKNHFDKSYPAFVRNVKLISNDSTLFGGAFISHNNYIGNKQLENQTYKLPFKYNNIRITFSAAFYEDADNLEFKYFLEGNDKDWSMWTKENYKEYSNLSPKQYTFYIKAKNIYGIESTIATYKFSIVPPWYRSSLAYVGYVFLAIFIILVILNLYTRRLRKQKEQLEDLVKERTLEIEQQNEELEAQTEELELQNVVIQKKNEDITSSIEYAERIQRAMLPVKKEITKHLENNFILFKPRDIVSGDFYWFAYENDKIIITAADCTGHGVPGAFMSMIGAETLTTIVNKGVTKAGEILDLQNKYIRSALKQETSDNQDGMDMALCVIDKKAGTIEFAGAKNPLLYIHNDELLKIKADKQAIGGRQIRSILRKKKKDEVSEKPELFKTTTLKIKSPMWFYLFSDGYQDQFGGKDGRKFMIKRMKKMIFENHKKPMDEQKQILDNAIEDWKHNYGEYEQTDDILVIGFKL